MSGLDADAKGNDRFNAEAMNWDQKPTVVQSGILARAAYLKRLPPRLALSTLSVLDIGCGTGLLSLSLAPLVHDLTAVDAAEGMIAVLSSKLSSSNPIRSLSPPGVTDAPILGTSITNVLPSPRCSPPRTTPASRSTRSLDSPRRAGVSTSSSRTSFCTTLPTSRRCSPPFLRASSPGATSW